MGDKSVKQSTLDHYGVHYLPKDKNQKTLDSYGSSGDSAGLSYGSD
jgi:hypothetical protein